MISSTTRTSGGVGTSPQLVRRPSLRTIVLLAPIVFIVHVLEEAPTFVAWFNAHVERDITEPLFRTVNASGLAITAALVVFEWLSGSTTSAALIVMWLSFLMLANGVFHIVAAFVDGAYAPGVVTAALLYVPYYGWLVTQIVRTNRLSRASVTAAAIVGAIPMCVHGYLILFRASRLF